MWCLDGSWPSCRIQHTAVSVHFILLALQRFRCLRTRLRAPHVTPACTRGDGGVFFQGGCVCVCVRYVPAGPAGECTALVQPWWASRQAFPSPLVSALLCFSTQSPTLHSSAGKTRAMLGADWGRLINSRVASQQEQRAGAQRWVWI